MEEEEDQCQSRVHRSENYIRELVLVTEDRLVDAMSKAIAK